MHDTMPRRSHHAARTAGFTLIESMLAIVIVSTAVLAVLGAQQAFHYKNLWAQRYSTGFLLASNVREAMLNLPAHDPQSYRANFGAEEPTLADFDDVDDFDGMDSDTLAGCIDAARQTIDDLPQWRQQVEVINILPDDISSTLAAPDFSTDLLRVTVTVTYTSEADNNPVTIAQLSWVIPDRRAQP